MPRWQVVTSTADPVSVPSAVRHSPEFETRSWKTVHVHFCAEELAQSATVAPVRRIPLVVRHSRPAAEAIWTGGSCQMVAIPQMREVTAEPGPRPRRHLPVARLRSSSLDRYCHRWRALPSQAARTPFLSRLDCSTHSPPIVSAPAPSGLPSDEYT